MSYRVKFIVMAALFLIASAASAHQSTVSTILKNGQGNGYLGMAGDLNEDGIFNITDVTSLISCLLGEEQASEIADVDGDYRLSIKDITSGIDLLLCGRNPAHVFMVDGCLIRMIEVEGGTFNMGGYDNQAFGDELPVHEVTLSTFLIGETEVDNDLWEWLMGDDPQEGHPDPRCPCVNIMWGGCWNLTHYLTEQTGFNFRLPTEAEWEYAARGGKFSHGYIYSGSDNYDDVAWCELNSGDVTQHVGIKRPNELGIYDTSGNVWEWCQDWFGPYSSESCVNPTGPETGTERVVRGGCMWGHVRFCRTTYRMSYEPNTRRKDIGFRLAISL